MPSLALVLTLAACGAAAAPTSSGSALSSAALAPSAGAATGPASSSQASTASSSELAAGATVAPSKLTTVRFGSVNPSASDAGWLIAKDKGYFAEQGIQLTVQRFSNGSQMVPSLGTNQIDVGGGAVGAGLFNAAARGVPLVIAADKGSTPPGHGFQGFVVRKDLVDSGKFKGPADLKGMKVAITGKAQAPEVSLADLLQQGGLTLEDINLTIVPFTDMLTSFINKNLDAAEPIEPFLTTELQKGAAVLYKRSDVYAPNQQIAVIIFSPKFAANRELATRWMVAYLKGVRLYDSAFVKNDAAARTEVVDILAMETNLKDKAQYAKVVSPGVDGNGKVNVEDLKKQQMFYVANGEQQRPVNLDTMVDPSFAAAAVKQLGLYH